MPLRQLQVEVPGALVGELEGRCASRGAERVQHVETGPGQSHDLMLVVCNVGSTGPMLHLFETFFADHGLPPPAVVIVPVAAVVPEPANAHEGAGRVAWEELRGDIGGTTALNRGYILFIILSAVMGTLGLLTDDVAVVIAAMVVAPLFGPLMGVALGIVMADRPLWKRALLAEAAGLLLAVAIGAAAGLFAPGYLLAASHQIQLRAQPNLASVVLALGAGVAGALSLASVVANALVGVAVAVALMPPALVVGMGIGAGNWSLATGAGLLLWINMAGGVLAAMVTFQFYRILPRPHFNLRTALRTVRWASLAVAALLVAAAAPVYVATERLAQQRVIQSEVSDNLQQVSAGSLVVQSVQVDNASDGVLTVDVTAVGGPAPSAVDLLALRAALQAELGTPVAISVQVVPAQTVSAP